MDPETRKTTEGAPSVWTPANIVTCVRIVFIPVFMVLAELSCIQAGALYDPVLAPAACILYILLSLTDKLDGYLARSRNEITDFGKFLDPIADKLLVFSALLILLEQEFMGVWVVFIILLREFLVSALRMVAGAKGVVIAADTLGKWKTAVTMIALRLLHRHRDRVCRRRLSCRVPCHRRTRAHYFGGGSHRRLGRAVFLERPRRHLLVRGGTHDLCCSGCGRGGA